VLALNKNGNMSFESKTAESWELYRSPKLKV